MMLGPRKGEETETLRRESRSETAIMVTYTASGSSSLIHRFICTRPRSFSLIFGSNLSYIVLVHSEVVEKHEYILSPDTCFHAYAYWICHIASLEEGGSRHFMKKSLTFDQK